MLKRGSGSPLVLLIAVAVLAVGAVIFLQISKKSERAVGTPNQPAENLSEPPEFPPGHFSVKGSQRPGYILYTEKNAGFSFEFPVDAELTEDEGTLVHKEINGDGWYDFRIRAEQTINLFEKSAFDKFVEGLPRSELEGARTECETTLSPTKITLSGKPAYIFRSFDCVLSGTDGAPWDSTIILVLDDGIVFKASAYAFGENRKANLETVEAIALSLKFSD